MGRPRIKDGPSRAKFACSAFLEQLIEEVNYVDPDTEMADWRAAYSKRFNQGDPEGIVDAIVTDIMEMFPEDVVRKTYEQAEQNCRLFGIDEYDRGEYTDGFLIRRCSAIRDAKLLLHEIAEYFGKVRQGAARADSFIPSFPVTATIRYRGTVSTIEPTSLTRVLDGVDNDRIRACEQCSRIYWAKRSDSKACSPRCNNTLNIAKSRARTDEEKQAIAERQRQNRATRRRLKENRKAGGK